MGSEELKALFTRRKDTVSDTHDALRCKRCSSVKTYSVRREPALSDAQTKECADFLEDLAQYIRESFTVADIHADAHANAHQGTKEDTQAASATGRDGQEVQGSGEGLGLGLDSGLASESETQRGMLDARLAVLAALRAQLEAAAFASLPRFSRALRSALTAMDREEEAYVAEKIEEMERTGPPSESSGSSSASASVLTPRLVYPEFLSRWSDLVAQVQSPVHLPS